MKATHNPPTGEPATPAEVLRGAALYLSRHGWIQGMYYLPTDWTDPTPPACLVGAIGMACEGRQAKHLTEVHPDYRAVYRAAIAAMVAYLDLAHPIHLVDEDGYWLEEHSEPFAWNDSAGHTAEDVIDALNAAADEWEHRHATGGDSR
ncbi:DUF6197 family protein [Micromonospora cathayae]|uniref:SUKH-3 immunity protein n=1 Tax=Micromonospora cathayae TaxID=3028804 RepID=A0ABY7ZTJ8_9ACTN|nr:hypothetical protein [Micromonospora sp. HUAS 3]WDZ86374.1 hypothetical protein PVK37_08220 [Micromonospora sp. HUAS 3]